MGRGDPTGVSCFASCGQTFGSGGDLREKTLLRVLLPGTEVVVWLLVLLKCFQFTLVAELSEYTEHPGWFNNFVTRLETTIECGDGNWFRDDVL